MVKVAKPTLYLFTAMRTIEYMRKFTFPVVIEEDEDGFFAECPSLEGCVTQGDTYVEALNNIKEAIQLYLEALEADREKIPEPVSSLGSPMVEVFI